MKTKAYLSVLLLFALLIVKAQDNLRLTVDWKKWEQMSSRQLLDKAHNYLVMDEHPDSQLLLYSIVANRYYAKPKDTERR